MLYLFFGGPASGKTYLMAQLMRQYRETLFMVHDPKGQHEPAENIRVFRGTSADAVVAACKEYGSCCLVLDEIAAAVKERGVLSPELQDIAVFGRHLMLPDGAPPDQQEPHSIGLWAAALRPKMVPRTVTSMARGMFLFQLWEPGDLKYIADYCGQEVADQVPNLPKWQHIFKSFEGDSSESSDS